MGSPRWSIEADGDSWDVYLGGKSIEFGLESIEDALMLIRRRVGRVRVTVVEEDGYERGVST